MNACIQTARQEKITGHPDDYGSRASTANVALPCAAMGTFPVRFPSAEDPGDTGWHIDMSFDHHKTDFMEWRANVSSKGRALLMLFLFSDIAADDAPTRIRGRLSSPRRTCAGVGG